MFRKAKAKTSPSEAIEAARRQINAAIDEAEKIAGPAALTELLQESARCPALRCRRQSTRRTRLQGLGAAICWAGRAPAGNLARQMIPFR